MLLRESLEKLGVTHEEKASIFFFFLEREAEMFFIRNFKQLFWNAASA